MEVTYQRLNTLTNLNEPTETGWVKQINIVKWGNKEPMYDIRSWKYEGDTPVKMSKGVSLKEEEFTKLIEFCKSF